MALPIAITAATVLIAVSIIGGIRLWRLHDSMPFQRTLGRILFLAAIFSTAVIMVATEFKLIGALMGGVAAITAVACGRANDAAHPNA